jgi:hypothetical protein
MDRNSIKGRRRMKEKLEVPIDNEELIATLKEIISSLDKEILAGAIVSLVTTNTTKQLLEYHNLSKDPDKLESIYEREEVFGLTLAKVIYILSEITEIPNFTITDDGEILH